MGEINSLIFPGMPHDWSFYCMLFGPSRIRLTFPDFHVRLSIYWKNNERTDGLKDEIWLSK